MSGLGAGRRPNTAARRQQQNLAGAGNIIAWHASTKDPPTTGEAAVPSDLSPRLESPPNDEVPESKASPDISHFDDKHSAFSGRPTTAGDAVVTVDAVVAAAQRAQELAGERLAQLSSELLYLSTNARMEMDKDHPLFLRVLIHRVQEARSLQHLWHDPARLQEEDAAFSNEEDLGNAVGNGWLDIRASVVPAAGFFLQAFRHLQTSSHESVAVDFLHALASCSGKASLAAIPVDYSSGSPVLVFAESEVPGPLSVTLAGGFPVWHPASFPSVDWLEYVCPVLETLLYTCYEDYLTVALRSTGFLLEAVSPLFELGALCTAVDLATLEPEPDTDGTDGKECGEDEDDTSVGTGYDEGVDAPASERRKAMGHGALQSCARQVVRAVGLIQPLVHAMGNAAEYGGRVAKLAGTRIERLHELHASVQHLVRAWSNQRFTNLKPASGGTPPPGWSSDDL